MKKLSAVVAVLFASASLSVLAAESTTPAAKPAADTAKTTTPAAPAKADAAKPADAPKADATKTDEGKKFSDMALSKANAAQSYQYARQLQRDHKQDQAFAIYREMEKKYPDSFYTYAGKARLAVGAGNYDEALKQMKLCQAAAPEVAKSQIQTLINRLEKKENINQ